MDTKIVVRKYREHDAEWEKVTIEQAIHNLEGAGYWKEGTVKEMLEEGRTVHNPFAAYKMMTEDDDGNWFDLNEQDNYGYAEQGKSFD